MIELSSPPPRPVPWEVTVSDEFFITDPCRTAFAAAASVRLKNGQSPQFAECDCVIYEPKPIISVEPKIQKIPIVVSYLVDRLGCKTCKSDKLPGHVEPCISCEGQDSGYGTNWRE